MTLTLTVSKSPSTSMDGADLEETQTSQVGDLSIERWDGDLQRP